MIIKITEKCDMGCTHCLNNADMNGRDMSVDTFKDILKFLRRESIGQIISISGGEPMMNPDFFNILSLMLKDYMDRFKNNFIITVCTNGERMNDPDNMDIIQDLFTVFRANLVFSVSNIPEYYPRKVVLDKSYRFFPQNVILTNKLDHTVMPMGRAKTNSLPTSDNHKPSCLNCQLVALQLNNPKLNDIEAGLAINKKFCIPHIAVDGIIKLGESDLCSNCSSIYRSSEEIIEDIINFKCDGCKELEKNIPLAVKRILNME